MGIFRRRIEPLALAIFLALASVRAEPGHSAPLTQPCDPREIAQELSEALVDVSPPSPALQGALEQLAEFSRHPSYWEGRDEPLPQIEKLFRSLREISDPVDRETAIIRVKQAQLLPGIRKHSLLALADSEAWYQYADQAIKGLLPGRGWLASPSLREAAYELPLETKRRIWREIDAAYRNASKQPMTPRGLEPKRAMDALLRIVFRGDLQITQAIETGASPIDAYASYLKALKSEVFPNSPVSTTPAAEIMKTARTIQSKLQSGHEVHIYGSYVNGQAHAVSDIDLGYSFNPSRPHEDSIKVVVSQMMRDNPAISAKEWTSEAQRQRMAKYNPVMLRITDKSIELLVFEPDLKMVKNLEDLTVASQPKSFPLD